ncbi:MAG: cysteine-rich CWC family protein [Bacteroidota bacterium]
MKLIEDEKCPKCGAMFSCGKSGKCWCYEVDVSPSIIDKIEKTYSSCLCPDCLKAEAGSEK